MINIAALFFIISHIIYKENICGRKILAWFYLIIAAFFEIGWPLGFKLAQNSSATVFWIGVSVISMVLSGYFLYLAQRDITIGTAYAVWTGLGASGTFVLGVLMFRDPAPLLSILGLIFIVGGVVLLKIAAMQS